MARIEGIQKQKYKNPFNPFLDNLEHTLQGELELTLSRRIKLVSVLSCKMAS